MLIINLPIGFGIHGSQFFLWSGFDDVWKRNLAESESESESCLKTQAN